VLTPEQYTNEAYKQLTNTFHYKELKTDPTNSIQSKIKNTVEKHKNTGAIPPKSASLLIQQEPKPARFYLLPKIHKNIESPQGRPIAASNGHPTEIISEYVDEILKEHINTIPSYIKDTNHFLEICQSTTLPANAKIATFDVTGLYTNIPHTEGLIALDKFMIQFTTRKRVNMLKDLTQLILCNNLIEFDGKLYIQMTGTSMGSKFAPSFSSIYMHWFESTHLLNAPIQPIIWRRFINDIFAVFICTDEELQQFYEWLNNLHESIKFTMDNSENGLPFLDTFVTIEGKKLVTRPYTKKTDRKQYILPSSCHPPHLIKAIPYSQALRIKRICTHPEDAIRELKNLKGFFTNRDYPADVVEEAITKAMNVKITPPTQTGTPRQKTRKRPPITMVIPYHPRNPRYQQKINELWTRFEPLLSEDLTRPIIGFTRPKNLRDILTKSRYGPSAIPAKTLYPNFTNRPHSTYDKQQMLAPLQHLTFKCPSHQVVMEKFNTLAEGLQSDDFKAFEISHATCGPANVIPTEVTHEITINCTECKFNKRLSTTKKVSTINCEILNVCDALRNAQSRNLPTHKKCQCNICIKIWNEFEIKDNRGTNYRLLPFDCQKKSVIYIIHCSLCNINYIGLTSQKLKQRLQNHISNIKTQKNTSVSRHFNSPGHSMDHHLKFAVIDHTPSNKNLHIREGLWISVLGSVSCGINEREEANSLDFQAFYYSKHYQHSRTCLPYMTSRITNITTLALKPYKRNILKPRPAKRMNRNTLCSTATAEARHTQTTLPTAWNVQRMGTAANKSTIVE
jgi:hypothetical protein